MSFTKGLFNQIQVVHALILRETRTRFGANYLGYLWAFFSPLSLVLLFWVAFYIGKRHVPNDMDPIGFLCTGILPYQLFRATSNQATIAIKNNKNLLFYPHVRPLDLIISRIILEMATFICVVIVLLGTNALILGKLVYDNLLMTISGFVLAGLLGSALGLFLCTLSVFSTAIERIAAPLFRPLFWTSGLFYTASELPSNIRDLVLFNPVLHTTELMRSGWFVSYHSEYVNLSYVFAWILGLSFAGLILERVARRKIEVT